MESVYYILIPIIASLIGGVASGLFTYLGVRMTLLDNKQTREEDLKLRREEQRRKEIEKNIEKNKRIIQARPELNLTNNLGNIKLIEEFCLLPYTKPELKNEKQIEFDYPDAIFKQDYWDKYEMVLQNTGKRKILSAFLQVPYGNETNLYSKKELFNWKHGLLRNYYSDKRLLSTSLLPNEKIIILIYYPKNCKEIRGSIIDAYLHDEDGNFWYQSSINFNNQNNSEIITKDFFYMHLRNECNYWYVYDSLYYSKNIKRCFTNDLSGMLEERKKHCWNEDEKNQQFVHAVNNGNIRLDTSIPLS